jgi:hypothetical protein
MAMDFDILEGSLISGLRTHMVYVRAAEPMVRVLKRARGKISLACGIQYYPNFFKFHLPDHRFYTVKNMCIHVHTYLTS